jgi:putative PIG3 family NAD(P)H quinone oxidoreductase
MPDPMRGVVITQPGPPSVLQVQAVPRPTPDTSEVLIAVEAAGVNRPDLMQRLGKYPPPPGASALPGLEVAGRIAALGPGVTRWREGDAVCALVAGGGYAEYCAAPGIQCLPVPQGLSMIEAAAMPETLFTVWTNVFERGRLTAGERLLVHGGASGIGTTAIQLGSVLGAEVFATAGSADKCAACTRLGAAHAINYKEVDFVSAIRDLADEAGVDVILDMVGGEYTPRNLSILRMDGRLVQIAFLQGPRVQIDLSLVMRRRLTLTGSTLRARSPEEKGAIARALEREVWPHVATGRVKPVIHATFALDEASLAHEALERGDHVGKIVLRVPR